MATNAFRQTRQSTQNQNTFLSEPNQTGRGYRDSNGMAATRGIRNPYKNKNGHFTIGTKSNADVKLGNQAIGMKRYDASFKVLLLGNSGVGKTSILRSLMGESFEASTISTIGIDLAKKTYDVEEHRIQLEIWDTAGQEQYNSIVTLHFREAKAFIIVYDVTSTSSLEQIRKYWLRSVDQHVNEPVPLFLVANKIDLKSTRVVSREQGEKLGSQQSVHGYFEVSAKTGANIERLFQHVAVTMVSAWGVPKPWYHTEQNSENGSQWPNQFPFRKHSIRLRSTDEHEQQMQKKKLTCCLTT